MASDIERTLRDAGAIPVHPRILRRVIKRHRKLPGIGLDVPHAGSYVLPREALAEICDEAELGCSKASLPDRVILLPRTQLEGDDVPMRMWRALYHATIHRELDRQRDSGALTPASLRARIHRIGQTEFDEIRFVLRHDDRLLPPHDDEVTYAEFAATYLEIRAFAPGLLERTFPALANLGAIDETLALDLDAAALLARCRPDGAPTVDELAGHRSERPNAMGGDAIGVPRRWRPRTSGAGTARDRVTLGPEVTAAAERKDHVRVMLAEARAWSDADDASAGACEAAVRAETDLFVRRVAGALKWRGAADEGWSDLLVPLVQEAASGTNPWNVEARLLFDVQKACIDHERETFAVDVMGWARSFGRRAVRRALPAQREVRVVKHFRAALAKAPRTSVPEPDRGNIARMLRECVERAEMNLRTMLRPKIEAALTAVKLTPESVPERVASKKLVDELIDQAVERGHLSLGHLRDAVSRNNLKMANVSGPMEIVRGDALLRADDMLATSLDGVYRRGEIYLRYLQRVSAVTFGTRFGRLLTLYALLPLGAAYVGLQGAQHIVGPISEHLLHLREPEIYTHTSFAITAVLILALLHSAVARAVAMGVLRAIGFVLHAIFFRIPRWIRTRPLIESLLASRPVLFLSRFVLRPLVVTAVLWLLAVPLLHLDSRVVPIAAVVAFLVANVALNSKVGMRVEEAAADLLARQWRELHRRVLPGLFALLANFFRAFVDGVERILYAVDAFLLFRRGDSSVSVAIKGALGIVWFFAAYIVRIYVNLLIEPQVNPIKHFPVVTVAAKILFPLGRQIVPPMIHALERVMPRSAARPIGFTSFFLLPGFFGFAVWELKENFKLYRMNRPTALSPVAIGHHGETMAGLLKPGFHSGTIPKTYAKLRRATWRGGRRVLEHREALHHVEEAIRRFVERELITLLQESPRWTPHVEVGHIEIASNRVRIGLVCESLQGGRDASASAKIAFEEQSGWLLGSVAQLGWIAKLDEAQRLVLENGLAGFYKMAAVDIVRERLEAELRGADGDAATPAYDVSEEGVVVWPDGGYKTEIVYRLDGRATLTPIVRGGDVTTYAPRTIDAKRILFRDERIEWKRWADAWGDAAEGHAPRILTGPSLLPVAR